jgi:hypothetical protein
MNTTKPRKPELPDGGPLAVCINDCQLDYGQQRAELVRVCFQVRCAFAEMRWGSSAAAACIAVSLEVDENRPTPPR